MDISRREKLKCNICQLILQSPIILPCRNSICQDHIAVINENENFYRCQLCNEEHNINKQITSNTWAIDLFNDLVGYKRAENACESLKSAFTELESLKHECTLRREETTRDIRTQAPEYRNELINEIVQKYEQFILDLDEDDKKFIDLNNEVESKMTNWKSNLDTYLSNLRHLNPNSESIMNSCKIEKKQIFDKKRDLLRQSQLDEFVEEKENFFHLKILNMGAKLVFDFKTIIKSKKLR